MRKITRYYYLISISALSLLIAGAACSTQQRGEKHISKKSQLGSLKDSASEETPVANTFIWENEVGLAKRKWPTPDFSNQDDRLGWGIDQFGIPEGLEVNFGFWKNIYQKYDSNQGVIHDSMHIDLIYEEVDFYSIMNNTNFDHRKKLKERRKLVNELKRKVKTALYAIRNKHKLDAYAEELKLKVSKYKEKHIYRELPKKGRLRFQLGQKDYIQRGMFHSGAYIDDIEEIFAGYGLPKELARLPYVESSYNLKARSKVGASGIWQIMPSTARGKLARSYFYDYRNHPLEAAHVAARLLKYNFKVLEDWPRAITAYNFGAAGMRRLSKKLRTKKIGELASKRYRRWGFAASNFYASYLAVLDTEKRARLLFGEEFFTRQALKYERIKLKKDVSLKWVKSQLGADLEEFKKLNPQIRFDRADKYSILRRKLAIYLPEARAKSFELNLAKQKAFKSNYDYRIHRVSRGETLSNIARRYRVSVKSIMSMNQMDQASFIRIGQKLRVPLRLKR